MKKMQRLSGAFVDVNSVKFAYSMGIEDQIYICFAKTHLCGLVYCRPKAKRSNYTSGQN